MADAETTAGLLPWLLAWLPRFDALTGRLEELGNNGNGAVAPHAGMAA